MALMTAKCFKDLTDCSGRSIFLGAIDAALENWEHFESKARAAKTPDDWSNVIHALYLVVTACKEWLAMCRFGLVQKVRVSALDITMVQKLMLDAKAEMFKVDGNMKKAYDQYEARKQESGYYKRKDLGTGYSFEREHYIHQGKRDPFSCNYNHGEQKNNMDDFLKHVEAKFKNDRNADANIVASKCRVAYLRKMERLKYMLYPGRDGLIYSMDFSPVDPTCRRPGLRLVVPKAVGIPFMWAMDEYGNLFARAADDPEVEGRSGYFSHSSFNAGKAVICAGILVIRDSRPGKLDYIDNNSGHYKPTPSHLHEAVDQLIQMGVDLNETLLEAFGKDQYSSDGNICLAMDFFSCPDPKILCPREKQELEAKRKHRKVLMGVHRLPKPPPLPPPLWPPPPVTPGKGVVIGNHRPPPAETPGS